MVRKIIKKMSENILLPAIIISVAALSLSGCSGSSGDNSSSSKPGSFSGKAALNRLTGGAVSVNLDDGSTVMLEVPQGALESDTTVVMTVSPEGELDNSSRGAKSAEMKIYAGLRIKIEPVLDLYEPAVISVVFPEKLENIRRYLTMSFNGKQSVPLKQGFTDNILTGTVYRFDSFYCTTPAAVEDMTASAHSLLNGDKLEGKWQDANIFFDALIYFSAYFNGKGNSSDQREYIEKITEAGLLSCREFIENTKASKGSMKESVVKNSIKKFRKLMVLCENPENIINELNELSADDN